MSQKIASGEKVNIVLQGLEHNKSILQICKEYDISPTQYYRWKKLFIEGGANRLEANVTGTRELSKKVKKLESQIRKYSLAVSFLRRNLTKEEQRNVVKDLVKKGVTVVEAVDLLNMSRSTYYYSKKTSKKTKNDDAELIRTILEIRKKNPRFGYRRVWSSLREKGWIVNKKKIWRIMKEKNLLVAR